MPEEESLTAQVARIDERTRSLARSIDEVRELVARRAVSWPAVMSAVAAVVSCAVVIFTRTG